MIVYIEGNRIGRGGLLLRCIVWEKNFFLMIINNNYDNYGIIIILIIRVV